MLYEPFLWGVGVVFNLLINSEKAALQESGVFLPLSCGFQAPMTVQITIGSLEPIFGKGMRRSTFQCKKKGFSVKRGEAIQ